MFSANLIPIHTIYESSNHTPSDGIPWGVYRWVLRGYFVVAGVLYGGVLVVIGVLKIW